MDRAVSGPGRISEYSDTDSGTYPTTEACWILVYSDGDSDAIPVVVLGRYAGSRRRSIYPHVTEHDAHYDDAPAFRPGRLRIRERNYFTGRNRRSRLSMEPT